MAPRLIPLIGAVPLFAAELAHAEPPAAAEGQIVHALVFASHEPLGPRRGAAPLHQEVDVAVVPGVVLDWVSPLFVWVEPGYAFAELSLSL